MMIVVFKTLPDPRPRPELKEEQVRHADMLRYDTAFHDPRDPARVIFPVFKTKHGTTPKKITWDRWRSFGLQLKDMGAEYVINPSQWITYRHPESPNGGTNYNTLVPQTLSEYMQAHGAKIAERHRS